MPLLSISSIFLSHDLTTYVLKWLSPSNDLGTNTLFSNIPKVFHIQPILFLLLVLTNQLMALKRNNPPHCGWTFDQLDQLDQFDQLAIITIDDVFALINFFILFIRQVFII